MSTCSIALGVSQDASFKALSSLGIPETQQAQYIKGTSSLYALDLDTDSGTCCLAAWY